MLRLPNMDRPGEKKLMRARLAQAGVHFRDGEHRYLRALTGSPQRASIPTSDSFRSDRSTAVCTYAECVLHEVEFEITNACDLRQLVA